MNALDLAQSRLARGELANAEAALLQMLQQQPRNSVALHKLGLLAMQRGEVGAAQNWLSQAAANDKRNPIILKDLAQAQIAANDAAAAVKTLRQCLKFKPDLAEAHFYLGWALQLRMEWKEAEQAYQRALRLDNSMAAHFNLGNLYLAQARGEPARQQFEAAIAMQPDFPAGYANLGHALRLCGDLAGARMALQRAAALAPDAPSSHLQLANCCHEQGDLAAAAAAFEAALELAPDFAEAHLGLAMTVLLTGDFKRGWREYQWRTRTAAADRLGLNTPRWRGETYHGKTLLLHAEQGFGDVIQFVRYLPAVAERGGRLLLVCHPELSSLLQPLQQYAEISAFDAVRPPHDLHLHLLDVAGVLDVGAPDSFGTTPYLQPDPEQAAQWRNRLRKHSGEARNVGLVWAGSPGHLNDRNRSMQLDALMPLCDLPGINWFSLQKGPAAKQLTTRRSAQICDLSKDLHDFAATAAAIAALDLLITVDTAVAHLAGAQNVPVWLMLPAVPDWRWGISGGTSAWYPSLRLFRQGAERSWDGVVGQIIAALNEPH